MTIRKVGNQPSVHVTMRRRQAEIHIEAPKLQRFTLTHNRERGTVLVMMTLAAIALFAALGLAVDVGRIFITKNELQQFCDSAALGAAQALNGDSTGIASAKSAVSSSTNTWNLGTANFSSPTVSFATASAGPWDPNPAAPAGYMYAKVTATVSLPLYFIPVVVSQTSQNLTGTAVAGQVPFTTPSFSTGLAPYTAVSTNTTGPNFGLTVGSSYDIQWPQYNSTRNGCSPGDPRKCFNSSPCSGDSIASQAAVVQNWGSSTSGYWGSSSNSAIEQEILDLVQLQAVDVGTNVMPLLSNGTKASEAGYLDERASQDINTSDNDLATYLASSHNGRRLIPVPIVDPLDPAHTNVVGYGLFFLLANGPGTSNYYTRTTNGNDPFCALYAGTYTVGSINPGVNGGPASSGAYRIKLVQ